MESAGELTSVEQVRELIPPPNAPAANKDIDHLDEHCREFIALSPFFVLASSDAAGGCDASPKGGPPGFVKVLDEQRLAVPDYPGNRRLDSYRNILERPGVQLIFLVPGMGETLRVTGRASLSTDPGLIALVGEEGRLPKLVLAVTVESAFLHCAKALKRSRLWEADSWADPALLPSAARIFVDHIALEGVTEERAEAGLRRDYEEGLWPSG